MLAALCELECSRAYLSSITLVNECNCSLLHPLEPFPSFLIANNIIHTHTYTHGDLKIGGRKSLRRKLRPLIAFRAQHWSWTGEPPIQSLSGFGNYRRTRLHSGKVNSQSAIEYIDRCSGIVSIKLEKLLGLFTLLDTCKDVSKNRDFERFFRIICLMLGSIFCRM